MDEAERVVEGGVGDGTCRPCGSVVRDVPVGEEFFAGPAVQDAAEGDRE